MIEQKILEEIAQSMGGTCDIGGALERTCTFYLGREPTEQEMEFIKTYLEDEGCVECSICGWYLYPGEGDGEKCDDCLGEEENG